MTKELCIEACLEAERICQECAEACSHDPNMSVCKRACDECAAACHRCHQALEKGSSEYTLECARACHECAQACARSDDPSCIECLEACRRAENACNEVYHTPGVMGEGTR